MPSVIYYLNISNISDFIIGNDYISFTLLKTFVKIDIFLSVYILLLV